MEPSNTLRSSLVGITMGAAFAGFCWWFGAQPGMVAAVGILWTAVGATKWYVDGTYEVAESKWSLVIGGAVLVASLAGLSVHSSSATDGSPLLFVIIGLSLLSYNAGMAAVYEQRNGSDRTRSTTPIRD
ncbi:MAG: hypothetical protein ACOC0Z_04400 [Halohasta sp.]